MVNCHKKRRAPVLRRRGRIVGARRSRVAKTVRLLMALAVAAWCGVTAQADPPLPAIPANSFNITDHGAFGDGISNNATAIQLTVNAAAAAGGGTVVVAAVGVLTNYLSGPFNLTNNVCLQINSNATIKMLAFGTYPGGTSPPDFISATSLHDVMVAGSGTIDGSAASGSPGWWDGRATSERPLLIKFDTCQSDWRRAFERGSARYGNGYGLP